MKEERKKEIRETICKEYPKGCGPECDYAWRDCSKDERMKIELLDEVDRLEADEENEMWLKAQEHALEKNDEIKGEHLKTIEDLKKKVKEVEDRERSYIAFLEGMLNSDIGMKVLCRIEKMLSFMGHTVVSGPMIPMTIDFIDEEEFKKFIGGESSKNYFLDSSKAKDLKFSNLEERSFATKSFCPGCGTFTLEEGQNPCTLYEGHSPRQIREMLKLQVTKEQMNQVLEWYDRLRPDPCPDCSGLIHTFTPCPTCGGKKTIPKPEDNELIPKGDD